jgi:hypothetical protein
MWIVLPTQIRRHVADFLLLAALVQIHQVCRACRHLLPFRSVGSITLSLHNLPRIPDYACPLFKQATLVIEAPFGIAPFGICFGDLAEQGISLRDLHVQKLRLLPLGLQQLPECHVQSLSHLTLHVTQSLVPRLASLSQLDNLQVLHLIEAGLKDCTLPAPFFLQSLVRLRTLGLHHFCVCSSQLPLVFGSSPKCQITDLRIYSQCLQDPVPDAIALLASSLRVCELANVQATDTTEIKAMVPGLPRLVRLAMLCCGTMGTCSEIHYQGPRPARTPTRFENCRHIPHSTLFRGPNLQ